MPKHRPIRFKAPDGLDDLKGRLKDFTRKHPVATSTAKAVLALAVFGGAITLIAAVPGLTKLFDRHRSQSREIKDRYKRLWKSFYDLKKKNLFEYKGEDKEGFQIYQLKSNGITLVKKFALDTLVIDKPKRWDGQWRLVLFDIPEKYKRARQALQGKLKTIGFYPLQKSVWVHPFPCEAEIVFLKDVFNIHPFVELVIAKEIKNGKVFYYFQDLLKDFT